MTTGNETANPIMERLAAIEERLRALEAKTQPLNVYGHYREHFPSDAEQITAAIGLIKKVSK